MAVSLCVELTNGFPSACIPSSGLVRLTWQQLGLYLMDSGVSWLHMVPRRRSGCALSTVTGARWVVSDVKLGPAGYTIDTAPSPGCALQGPRPCALQRLRLWWPQDKL